MIEAWTAADVRAAEEPLLAAGVPLMERAAFALATVVARDVARRRSVVGPDGGRRDGPVRGARVALLVGSGNNGGDALHAGAGLRRRGADVVAVLTGDRTHPGGLAALRAAGGRVHDLTAAGTAAGTTPRGRVLDDVLAADAVLDGLVGIGASGALRGPAGELVADLVRALAGRDDADRPWVVAVDAPSGVGVDDGAVPGPVLPADRTVTFGVAKPGLLLPPATHRAGAGVVVDLGLEPAGPPALRRLEDADAAARWPVPGPTSHKYTRGVVGLVAGTPTFPGAAVLAATAAVRAGAGMVRYRGPDDVARAVVAARPEVVPAGGRVQAWALGPGLPGSEGAGQDAGQHARVHEALAAASGRLARDVAGPPVPAVVDAGAISLVEHACPPWVVLTPHAGELAALLRARGEDVDRAGVEAEPLRWARRAHALTGATVLLKGSATVVVGEGTVLSQADAPPWLATAGAGDVLTGVLGALLAARSEEVVARPALAAELAAVAALVHGRAASRACPGGPVAALDVADAVPATVAALLAARP